MRFLFDSKNLIALESLSFTKAVYAFDFDGTLAKIVKSPDSASLAKTTMELLRTLCDLVPVAIISGRGINDLKEKVGYFPDYLVGNHGLEGLDNPGSKLEQAAKMNRKWIQQIRSCRFEYGVEIEDKTYSLSIHYRKSRKKALAKTQILKLVERMEPSPNVILGKCVVNLIPVGAPHKGTALLKILKRSGCKHAFYIGDDDTDEDVFSVPYSQGQILSVRVGQKRRSSASYYIRSQSEINRLLKYLIRIHSQNPMQDRKPT